MRHEIPGMPEAATMHMYQQAPPMARWVAELLHNRGFYLPEAKPIEMPALVAVTQSGRSLRVAQELTSHWGIPSKTISQNTNQKNLEYLERQPTRGRSEPNWKRLWEKRDELTQLVLPADMVRSASEVIEHRYGLELDEADPRIAAMIVIGTRQAIQAENPKEAKIRESAAIARVADYKRQQAVIPAPFNVPENGRVLSAVAA